MSDLNELARVSKPQGSLRILIAESKMKNMLLIKTTLEESDHQIDIAFDGPCVVQKLLENQYDLVVLNWRLPGMSGDIAIGAAQRLINKQKIQRERITPVVVYTTVDFSRIELLNVEDFIIVDCWQKPRSFKEITKRVNTYLFDFAA